MAQGILGKNTLNTMQLLVKMMRQLSNSYAASRHTESVEKMIIIRRSLV
jgi:hypothetical protein